MTRESLALAAIQSGVLFLAIWLVFRQFPFLPPNAKAWIWRLAFLKPLACLVPVAAVTLYVLPRTPLAPGASPLFPDDGARSLSNPSVSSALPVESALESGPIGDPLLGLWLAGAVGVAIYGLSGHLRAVKTARSAPAVTDPRVLAELDDLLRRAGVTALVRLLTAPGIGSPMLLGGRRPTILLPETALRDASATDLRLMLAHEVAHLVRRDLAWFGGIWLVQTLFFFNPVVWLAARSARLDHESATDRYASKLAGVPIHTYADMLLRATVVARPSLMPGVVPMAESHRTIHRRLEAMRHFDSKLSLGRKSAVAAILMATASLIPNYLFAEPPLMTVPSPGGPIQRPEEFSMTFKGDDIQSALRVLFRKARRNYRVDGPLKGKLMLSMTNVSFECALQNIVQHAEGTYRVDRGVYRITARKLVPEAELNAPNSPWWTPPPMPTPEPGKNDPVTFARITADFQNADVREALRQLFRISGKSYSIDPNLQGAVTVKLKDVPFQDALDKVLQPCKGMYSIEDGVYVMKRKPVVIDP